MQVSRQICSDSQRCLRAAALPEQPFIADEDIQAMLDDLATYKQVLDFN
jgi:hypothetical protein